MKTYQKEKGSFFSLLLKYFLVFTVVIAILVSVIYFFVSVRVSKIINQSSPEVLMRYEDHILTGEYEEIPLKRIFGKDGYMEVLDEELNVIYQSKEMPKQHYTKDSLKFMAELFISTEGHPTIQDFNHFVYSPEDGEEYTLVYGYHMSEYVYEEKDFILLDSNRNIVNTSLDLGINSITEAQYDYLTKRSPKDFNLYKHHFKAENGETHTILFYFPFTTPTDLDNINETIFLSFGLLVALYIVIIIGFVGWLYKTVKKPMDLLNDAIIDFSDGTLDNKLEYTGAREFVQICDRFNKMAEMLEQSEERRKHVEDSKQKMLADISHDLKTPITVIQGYSKAIYDGIVPEERKDQYLSTIYQKSFVLTELINKFYEFSKLEHPDFKILGVKMDVCECLRVYLGMKYNEIDLAGFKLDVDIPEERIYCVIDKLHLKRAFENILVNSLKHNPVGTTIFFRIVKEGEYAVITIADNGVGIPKDITQNIFEAFVVGDDSRNNRQGSGLGLAITSKIVKAHGGHVKIIYPPTLPYSTEFRICIPLCEDH